MKDNTYKILMVVGFYLAIIGMLLTVMILWKNANEISSEPIAYAIDKYDLAVCTCYDKQGISYDFFGEDVNVEEEGWNINLQE